MNLSGVHHEEIRRGMVLGRPGSIPVARSVVARLRGSRILEHPLQHDAEVTVLAATAQAQARARLLDAEALLPGDECWAQFALETPIALLPGDHLIVRSPDETIGGGPVVNLNGRRLRRHHEPTLRALELALSGTPEDRALEYLAAGPRTLAELATALGLEPAGATALVATLEDAGAVLTAAGRTYSVTWLEGAERRLDGEVAGFLAANALRRAAPREHLRRALGLEPAEFELVIQRLVSAGRLEERGSGLAPAGFEPALSEAQAAEVDTFLRALRANPYSPPTDRLPEPALLAFLAERGDIEDTGAGVVFAAEAFAGMVERVRGHFAANPTLSLAETRDLFGTSRKYAQAFLEHLDALRITRRNGDTRMLR